jgi:hypothetical protein
MTRESEDASGFYGSMLSPMGDIYNSGEYLAKNRNWHQEDSPYKARLVSKILDRNSIGFSSCVDVGCGAGAVTHELALKYPFARFCGMDSSRDVVSFWSDHATANLSFSSENALTSGTRYDLALCLDVFEHIDDYIGFLRDLRQVASRFVFNIPLDMNVAKLITGLHRARVEVGHLHYFNRYTALETLKYAGYTIDDEFLSPAFQYNAPRNLRQALILIPRLVASALGKRAAALLLGGHSLVVLAS